MTAKRKKKISGLTIALLVGGGLLAWHLFGSSDDEPEAAPRDDAADLLRGLVVTESSEERLDLLKRYQKAEGLRPTGHWTLETAAKAEARLANFGPEARELLAEGLGRDPLFRVSEMTGR